MLLQGVPELLDVRVLGVERRFGRKHVRLYCGVPGFFEPPLHLSARDPEGVAVGDDDYGAFAEILPEDLGNGGERARLDIHVPRVGSLLKGRV